MRHYSLFKSTINLTYGQHRGGTKEATPGSVAINTFELLVL